MGIIAVAKPILSINLMQSSTIVSSESVMIIDGTCHARVCLRVSGGKGKGRERERESGKNTEYTVQNTG